MKKWITLVILSCFVIIGYCQDSTNADQRKIKSAIDSVYAFLKKDKLLPAKYKLKELSILPKFEGGELTGVHVKYGEELLYVIGIDPKTNKLLEIIGLY